MPRRLLIKAWWRDHFWSHKPIHRGALVIAYLAIVAGFILGITEQQARVNEVQRIDREARIQACETRALFRRVLTDLVANAYAPMIGYPIPVVIDGRHTTIEVVSTPEQEKRREAQRARVLEALDAIQLCDPETESGR